MTKSPNGFRVLDRAPVLAACRMIGDANAHQIADRAAFDNGFLVSFLGDVPTFPLTTDAAVESWEFGRGAAKHYYPREAF